MCRPADERVLHSGKDSEHVFQDRSAAGMTQGVRLSSLMTEIGNFQDRQVRGVLTDAAVMNLTSHPPPDKFTTSPASGQLTAPCGKSIYSTACAGEGRWISPAPRKAIIESRLRSAPPGWPGLQS